MKGKADETSGELKQHKRRVSGKFEKVTTAIKGVKASQRRHSRQIKSISDNCDESAENNPNPSTSLCCRT